MDGRVAAGVPAGAEGEDGFEALRHVRGAEAVHRQLAVVRGAVLFADGQEPADERERGAGAVPADAERVVRGAVRSKAGCNNAITLRLQPNEGINAAVQRQGAGDEPRRCGRCGCHFSYDSEFGAYTPEAYERLLLEAMAGDATLFIRRDELETAWSIVDAIRAAWADQPLTNREFYAAGTWGPIAADDLLERNGHAWRNPQPVEAKPA